MPLPSNPLTDAINAAWQKEIARITPRVEDAYSKYEQIDALTAQVVTQVNAKLDQLAATAPDKAAQLDKIRGDINNMAEKVSLWTARGKNVLHSVVS